MTLKSVVDIDLNDEKFKRFQENYNKYQEALKAQPQQWGKAGEAVGQVDEAVNKILAAFLAMGSFHQELAEADEKDNKNLKNKLSMWEKINKASSGVLKDVGDTAKWFMKWGSIGFGLSLAGLFGLRAIAEDVAQQRNQALGLDIGIGEEKAFGLHQGRYFNNPDALLQGAFTARSNLSSPAFQAIASLGINPNQPTVAIANQLLLKLQAMAKAMPLQQVGNLLQMFPGISQFGLGLSDLERLRNLSTSELRGQIAQFGPEARAFGLSDRQGQAFQDFVTSIDSTFGRITKQIERDLVPLLGPIEKLMTVIGKDITTFLRGGMAAKAIDGLAHSIDDFAHYLGQGKFNKDVKDFSDGVTTFVNVVGFAAQALRHPLDTAAEGAEDQLDDAKAKMLDYTKKADAQQRLIEGGQMDATGLAPSGFIRDMGLFLKNREQTPALAPPQNVGGGHVTAHANVNIKVMNATGANLNYSVNALNGGVGGG